LAGAAASIGGAVSVFISLAAVGVLLYPRSPCSCTNGTLPILLQKVHNFAQEYELLYQRCPTLDDLVRVDLLKEEQTKDPFGNELRVRCTLNVIEVRSAGKDGRFNTADDVVHAEPLAGPRDAERPVPEVGR